MAIYTPRTKAVTVTTAGVRVPLFDSRKLVASIIIETPNTNTFNVYVGGDDVSSANGIPIKPEKSIDMELQNDGNGKLMEIDASEIYLDSDSNGNTVRILWLERS